MCGILASYRVKHVTEKQLEVIKHRGPDDQTLITYENGVILGHVRLSIIDLQEHANQPMSGVHGRYHIVFNGEIFNYLELRSVLEKEGYVFLTKSDTEVLLHAYHHWKQECLNYLNGMFAFIIYDQKEQKVFCARDRFGIKPLYFTQPTQESWMMVSEIKQILSLPNYRPKANLERVKEYLSWRLGDHTDETFYREIFQLPAGCAMEIDLKASSVNLRSLHYEWYGIKQLQSLPYNQQSIIENSQTFKEQLTEAIHLRMRSDVSIATALSGGLDSSSLALLMHQEGYPQSTFTCCVDEAKYDESHYAKHVHKHLNGSYTPVYVRPTELFEALGRVVWAHDEPCMGNAVLMESELFRQMHQQGVRVGISGQGADEVFGGYQQYLPYAKNALKEGARGLLQFMKRQMRHRTITDMSKMLVHTFLKPQLYPERFYDIYREAYDPKNPHNTYADKMGLDILHSVRDYHIYMLKANSLPAILHATDRQSMAHSIEARVPFLDYRFVEFALSIPHLQLHHKGWDKGILRESLKGILPPKIAQRRDKKGFSNAQLEWANGTLRAQFHERLQRIGATYSFLDARKIDVLLKVQGHKLTNSIAWRLILFDLWVNRFDVDCT